MKQLNLLSLMLVSVTFCFAATVAQAQNQDDEPPAREREQNRDRDPRRGGQDTERPELPTRTPPPAPSTNPPQRDPRQPQTDAPRPDAPKPDASKPDNQISTAGRPGAEDGDDGIGGRMNPRAAQKKILLEEAKYRNQMARIARLRELATQQGNQQRLAALDKLEAKMTQLHQRKVAAARASLGDQEFEKLNRELEKGRGRGKGAGAAIGRGKGNDNRPGNAPPSAGRGKPDDDDRGTSSREPGARSEDRGKPDNASRPRQPGSNGNNQSADDRRSGGGRPASAGGGGGAAAGNRGSQNDNKGGDKGKGKP